MENNDTDALLVGNSLPVPEFDKNDIEPPVDFILDHEMINQASSFERPVVVKRRHSDRRKSQKRVPYAPSDTSGQVPEEVLFRQLLSRLRAREESDAVASNLQKEMEAKITAMGEENNVLKKELEILGSRLQKRTAEAKAYKSQTKSWKSKLGKIKTFLNEIGIDYVKSFL
ncbi:hypothetical protein BDV10DRAFT_186817 [Aspergillus recurvatus]